MATANGQLMAWDANGILVDDLRLTFNADPNDQTVARTLARHVGRSVVVEYNDDHEVVTVEVPPDAR